jgi:3-oxoacyl-[acyl-carrier protein] reductase
MAVSIVTGAGRGIGRATAVTLAEAGHQVVVTGRTEGAVRETAAECGGTAVVGDVTDPAHVAEVAAVAREGGGAVLLVNNAGTGGTTSDFLDADPGDWWRVLETNLRGPMLMCQALLPQMIERGDGRVVNLNSLAGMRAMPTVSAYSVSKAALARLTDNLAAGLQGTGVHVFDLSPGLVHTQMAHGTGLFDDVPEEEWTPMAAAVEAVVALASGRYDELSGRFLHATDDLDDVMAAAGPEGRRLRLMPAGEADPLFAED